jgi:hypothetical protein
MVYIYKATQASMGLSRSKDLNVKRSHVQRIIDGRESLLLPNATDDTERSSNGQCRQVVVAGRTVGFLVSFGLVSNPSTGGQPCWTIDIEYAASRNKAVTFSRA